VRQSTRPQARSAGARAAAAAGVCAAAGLIAAACSRPDSPSERALAEIEELAFVPSGAVPVGMVAVPLALYECPDPLLVDRFETTQGRWEEYAAARPDELSKEMLARVRSWRESQEDLPATWMTQVEAQQFAAWRGMRLLSPGEWLFAALGKERRPYPHGIDRQDSIFNTLDLGLGRSCAVGTFEGGRTPGHIYDLLGNVAEWVDGDVLANLSQAPLDAQAGGEHAVSALGGSYRTWLRPIFRWPPRAGESAENPFLAYNLHPLSRQDDVGLRCATPARPYLERSSSLWGNDERALERLREVGERWGRSAVPLLRELASRANAAPGLNALLEGARR
jgi:formylglycine-generating enzyme required for sulfatase activity